MSELQVTIITNNQFTSQSSSHIPGREHSIDSRSHVQLESEIILVAITLKCS